ncbi:MAG: sensor histidine kinase, partial [Methanococcaceae archaeon]
RVKAEETTHELQAQKNRSALILDKLEEERCRISRELHDSIGQILYAAKFNLEVFEKSSSIENKQIAEAKKLISTAGRELKSIIYSLHPIIIDNYGLLAALEHLCKEFTQTTGIKPEFNIGGLEGRLDSRIELNVYRIVQEAFNNINKHAKAGAVQLKLIFNAGTLAVMINDNGIGFEHTEFDDPKHGNISFGIINMKERAEMMGGDFQIESSPDKGTEIRVNIPIE